MFYVYADQNFLSSCIENLDWITCLRSGKENGFASIVLSPLHFYEFGNAREDLKEGLLQLIETLEPAWAYSPADLQMIELVSLWCEVWGANGPQITPICTFHEVLAVMHRRPLKAVENITIRQAVEAFQGVAQRELKGSIRKQRDACDTNQALFRQQCFTKTLLRKIDAEHVSVQLARWERDEDAREVLNRAHLMLAEQPTATYIDCFLYWQLHKLLRSYQVESHLSEQMWSSSAKLKVNRFVDRMHALVALPFCDIFVTDDRELSKRCEYARSKVKSKVARVLTSAELIAYYGQG